MKFYRFCFIYVFFIILICSCAQEVEFSTKPGSLNALSTESFVWNNKGRPLDILVVVDNSSSMASEQRRMGERFDQFLDRLDDVDWQLGITTTDVSNGRYGLKGELIEFVGAGNTVLDPQVPSYETAFRKTVRRKESIDCLFNCPSSNEQPLKAAMLAMRKKDSENAGFFRNDAHLAVVVLSDEDEMSRGPRDATRPYEVLTELQKTFSLNKGFTVYGIIVQPGDRDCLDDQGGQGHFGHHVQELADLTEGLTGSICDGDYSDSLNEIGQSARESLDSLYLKAFPQPETLKVTFSAGVDIQWTLRGRRLQFQPIPPEGTEISVRYVPKK